MRNRSILALVALLLVGMVAITGYGARGATAQDAELTADLVEGSCDSPGDSVGELRSLAEAEGGVLTSFTRVDIAIDDITGDDHAVVVSLDGDAVACGDISGSGNDVYVPVVAQGDGGYGGVAWLHAREEQTQISLFVSEQLGGGGDVPPTEGPEPPPDDTETPEPRPTRTPRGGGEETPTPEPGEGTQYESPSYGYTFTYDDSWEVREDGTNPTDSGPQDFIHLYNGTSHAYFYTNGAPDDYDMGNIPDLFMGRLTNQDGVSDVAIMDDVVEIDEDEAVAAYTFTYTTADGQELELYDHYHVFRLPGQETVVIFLNEGLAVSYDQQASARDALTDSFRLP
jgi:hypothetical protein